MLTPLPCPRGPMLMPSTKGDQGPWIYASLSFSLGLGVCLVSTAVTYQSGTQIVRQSMFGPSPATVEDRQRRMLLYRGREGHDEVTVLGLYHQREAAHYPRAVREAAWASLVQSSGHQGAD